jgi:DinB superfamily
VDLRVDRVGLLVDSLDTAVAIARERLDGITDDELLWQPATDAFSVRRRGEAVSSQPLGTGEWVLDHGEPFGAPTPLRTIAWLVNHTWAGCELRWEWSFGARSRLDDDLEYSPNASVAIGRLWSAADRLARAVEAGDPDAMAQPGFGQYPHGLDPHVPFLAIVWWQTREVIHHLAEAAFLRDVHASRT